MLPKVNVLPVYPIDLKVIGQMLKYSPFNINQEKALIAALESDNTDEIVLNYQNIVDVSVQGKIDWDNLSMVDFVNLIVKIRSKSKGETLSLRKDKCIKCEKSFDQDINLDDSIVYTNESCKKAIVKITDDLSFEIKPLSYKFFYGLDKIKDEIDLYTHTALHCISKMIYKEKIYVIDSLEELRDNVIKNMSEGNLEDIFNKYKDIISIQLEIEYVCPFCGEKEKVIVENFLKSLK